MVRAMRWFCVGLIVAGWLGTAARAPAQGRNDPARKINDEAGLFSKTAIREAESEMAAIKQSYKKDVFIETRAKGPPHDEFKQWAQQRAADSGVRGVYIAITLSPGQAEVLADKQTRQSGAFTEADCTHTAKLIAAAIKAKQPDKALPNALHYIRNTLRANTAPKAGAAAPGTREPPDDAEAKGEQSRTAPGWLHLGGLGIGGIICLGLVALLVVWVVIGLIRSMFTPRYPVGAPGGGGYGGGYAPGYGPGYGGGGGGFFSSLLGGMFGAAAGMWMYNNFFGGHSAGGFGGGYPTGTPGAGGGYGNAPANPEASPTPGDYSGGGASWGDSDKDEVGAGKGEGDKGGDTGGGDWDGSGEAGGGDADGGDADGGDAGGDMGGGDWGGGGDTGGGDWGGGDSGGGGDFGGGGADW